MTTNSQPIFVKNCVSEFPHKLMLVSTAIILADLLAGAPLQLTSVAVLSCAVAALRVWTP